MKSKHGILKQLFVSALTLFALTAHASEKFLIQMKTKQGIIKLLSPPHLFGLWQRAAGSGHTTSAVSPAGVIPTASASPG
jgi:hypothetical protein